MAKAKPRPGPTPAEPAGLTYKQRLFVSYYLGRANGNATEAARQAGYLSPNVEGSRLLAKASIRAAVAARLAGPAMEAEEVLARLTEHATADMADFLAIPAGGEPRLDLAKARRLGKTHMVKEFRTSPAGITIKLHDAQAALVQLAKYHGLLDRIVLDDAKTEDLESHAAGGDPGGD